MAGGQVDRQFFAAVGLGLWLLATLVFRVAGQVFFLDDEPAVLIGLWLLGIAAMICVALEGFAGVFPNMSAQSAGSFAAWLLVCYASVLFAALMPLGRQ